MQPPNKRPHVPKALKIKTNREPAARQAPDFNLNFFNRHFFNYDFVIPDSNSDYIASVE